MSEQSNPIKAKYEKLHELIEKTAKNRFVASARLNTHKHWSIWTVTIMTISVIGLSLIQAMNIGNSSSHQAITFAITLLSTFILVYSITMSMSDFSVRSHHFHQCGLELMKLRGQVFKETIKEEEKQDKYTSLNAEYGVILDKYENHALIDYLLMQISNKSMVEYYKIRWYSKLRILIRYASSFWHYIFLISLSFGFLAWATYHFFKPTI